MSEQRSTCSTHKKATFLWAFWAVERLNFVLTRVLPLFLFYRVTARYHQQNLRLPLIKPSCVTVLFSETIDISGLRGYKLSNEVLWCLTLVLWLLIPLYDPFYQLNHTHIPILKSIIMNPACSVVIEFIFMNRRVSNVADKFSGSRWTWTLKLRGFWYVAILKVVC